MRLLWGTVPTVPTRAQIDAAATVIGPQIRRTPVIDYEYAQGRVAALKLELLQHAGSFKPRGAFTTVLSAQVRPKGLVAASGGNHGLAVAHVGASLRIPTDIFLPGTAPQIKVDAVRATGATVHLVGTSFVEAYEASLMAARADGVLAVHPYDADGTVTGQGTLAREIEEQLPDVDTVLVAVGGGGLIGGIAAWFAGRATVIAVEPQSCPTLHAALVAGAPVTVPVSGVAADSLGAVKVGDIGFAAAQAAGVRAVLVADEDILQACRRLWKDLRLAAEPGGATAMAALYTGAYLPADGERVCVVVCGGNADPGDNK